MTGKGVLAEVDAVAVHGFPLDWNHWQLDAWPDKLKEIQAVTDLPVWVSEVGVSTFGAEEVQVFGLKRTAELLLGRAPMIHWYSLYDLPRTWPATTRHREAEGSSYYRHFYMGLLREDGSPKLSLPHFADFAPDLGICQWFHFEDHRLDDAVQWLRDLGVRHLRTGPELGRYLSARTRSPGSTGRWPHWTSSTSPPPSASRPRTRASSRTTPAPGRCRPNSRSSAPPWSAATRPERTEHAAEPLAPDRGLLHDLPGT